MVVEERVDQQVKLNRWERLTMVLLQQLAWNRGARSKCKISWGTLPTLQVLDPKIWGSDPLNIP